MLYVAVFLTPLLLMFLFVSVKMLPQYQRGVVIRLGKVRLPKGPGLVVFISLLKESKIKLDTSIYYVIQRSKK